MSELNKIKKQMQLAEHDLRPKACHVGRCINNFLVSVGIMFFIGLFLLVTVMSCSNLNDNQQEVMNNAEASTTSSNVSAETNTEVQPVEASTYSGHGVASTYGWGERLNVHTSCGDVFDPMSMTIAVPAVLSNKSLCHKPAKVTYKGKTVDVIIADGGPAGWTGRVADLTKGVFQELGVNSPTVITIDLEY